MPDINNKTLKELDQARQQRIPFIETNNLYVEGLNPTLLNEQPKKKPDNRVPVPLAKIAVQRLCGFAGRAGDITVSWEDIENDDKDVDTPAEEQYNQVRKEISEHNESDLETSKQYETALTQGESYQLFWVSDDLDLSGIMTPEYTIVPNREIVNVWSRDLKPKLLATVRFQVHKEGKNKVHTADVYYPELSEMWQMTEGKNSGNWIRNEEGDTEYPYTKVPLAIYRINDKSLPLFQAEKGLIDGHDKILNNTLNEVDRFNALIALFPGLVTKEFRDKLIEVGVIEDLDQFERWPEYLQKDLNGVNELYTAIADRIERLFYQSVNVPDLSDENFANAQSGIAMAFKLLGFEFLASKIETYFFKGLKMKNDLINDVIGENGKIKTDNFKMDIDAKRNLPIDRKAAVEIAQMLSGIISKETLLKILPNDIIDDVKKELARLEGQPDDVDLDLVIDEE